MEPHTLNTASGRRIDLDAPRPDQITLEDLAGGLSRICRFGAQSVRFHSVAEHAVLVSRLVVEGGQRHLGLAALHHDSHEAYVCDLPGPLKRKLAAAGERVYDEVSRALDAAIFSALGIPQPSEHERAVIKSADDQALMIEAADLLPDAGASISAATGLAQQAPGQLGSSLAPDRARQEFLHIHEALRRWARAQPAAPPGGG